MKRGRVLWVLVAALTLAPVPGVAQAQEPDGIAVVGQVTNKTPDGPVPAELPITLHVFAGAEQTSTHVATLSDDGTFRFDNLTPGADLAFAVRLIYQGVTYFSEPARLASETAEIVADIAVYETTEDPAAVVINQLHLFLVPLGDRVQVTEYYWLGNAGTRTFVGADDSEAEMRATVVFPLPPDASDLGFDGSGTLGERYLTREGGFADTRPILPGSATVEVRFGYELAYWEGRQVVRDFTVPVDAVVMVVAGENLALEGEGVVSIGPLETEQEPANAYSAGPLAASDSLAFTLVSRQGAARAGPATGTALRNPWSEMGLGLVALAGAMLASSWLWRVPPTGPMPESARPLVASIAALDARFEAGDVTEEVYRQERASLKQQLRSTLGESETND